MGIFRLLFGSSDDEYDNGFYADLHEEFYGTRPNHKLTEDEKIELEERDEDEWEEDEDW